MTRLLLFALALGALGHGAQAQTTAPDTTRRDLGAVTVTATRAAQALEDVAVPTTVVTAQQFEADGALRLGDVLDDVPGVQLTSGFGTGVQIQGLDPAYTLILIDGQPVVGRTAGVLDLSRLSVRGIERVEVVRGPSSSLYGSDALAGVVNLITRRPEAPGLTVGARLGSFATRSLAAEAEGALSLGGQPWGARLTLDQTASDGYDLDPLTFGATTPATTEQTADLRLDGRLGPRTSLRLGARATTGDERLVYAFTDTGGALFPIDERGARRDWSVHPELRHAWGGRYAVRATGYAAGYRLDTQVYEPDAAGADSLTYDDRFDQRLLSAETQFDALWSARQRTTVGAGLAQDALSGARYGDAAPRAASAFAFAQHDWEIGAVSLNASARLDAVEDVGTRLTPRVAALWRGPVRLRASVGSGFRAPDFRQRYLDFANGVGGYTLFGAARLAEGLARLEAQGRYVPNGVVAVDLRPESSVAINLEAETTVRGVALTVGAFRNAVRDLIDVQPVTTLANGQPVYSYLNLDRVRTEGLTADAAARWRSLSVSAGYQWLRSRDLDVLDDLEAGRVFERAANGVDRRLAPADYANLFGRSAHAVTARAALAEGPWTASARLRWRSRYGLRDFDGNGLASRDDEFVPATALVDLAASRLIPLGSSALRVQAGLDNVFGTTRPALVPTLAGRRVFAALSLTL